jgi:branched-chain amino acid transport system substrate-binding protein
MQSTIWVRAAACAGAVITFSHFGLAGEKSIKIGVMADMSGFAADAGGPGAVLGAQLAVEDFGGKAGGKPIELLTADMQNKPDVAASIARKWFDEEGLDVIVDLPVSPVALAVQRIANEKKKPVVITAAATTEITGKGCTPWTVHLADDTSALGKATAKAILEQGGRSWFLVTADFAFGVAMANEVKAAVLSHGGTIAGEVKHPLATNDFSSFVLAAQASKAQVVALANSAKDTVNAIKTAHEFGLVQGGQKLASTLLFISDVHALGLGIAKGLDVVTGFYWDENATTRAFANRFFARQSKMPTKEQANTYAGVKAYLQMVTDAGTDDPAAVMTKFKSAPIDYFGKEAVVRSDGRAVYDLALYEVKSPEQSKFPWDYYRKVSEIKGEDAFLPLSEGGCPLVGQAASR